MLSKCVKISAKNVLATPTPSMEIDVQITFREPRSIQRKFCSK